MRWYVSQEGRSEGPLEEADVLERIASGKLRREAFAAPEGATQWQSIDAHPPFSSALLAKGAGRYVAATMVGVQAPRVPPTSAPGVVLSANGMSAPGVLAVPIAGEKPRRWPKVALGCVALLLPVLAAGGGTWLYVNRAPDPIEMVIESAEVEDIDRDAVASPELVEEMVRVRVRTEPGARVSVSSSREVQTGADGTATVLYAFGRTREPTVEIEVRVVSQDEGGRARESRERLTVERPARMILRGAVAECSTRSCALGVEADGALTVSGIDAATRVTLGESTAIGQAPDPSEEILAALSPDSLFSNETYTIPLPLRIELSDGTRFEGVYPVGEWTLRRVLFERFATIEEGAVEVPVEARGSAILWLGGVGAGRSAPDMRLVGSAATVGNIGRVALVTASPRRRSCGRYGQGQGARTAYVEQRNAQIVIHDRRRGRVWRRRTINAPAITCPRNITIEPGMGEIDAGHSEVDPDTIETWLRTL